MLLISMNIEIYFMISEHIGCYFISQYFIKMVFYIFLCTNNNVIIKFLKNDFYSEYNINHTSICKGKKFMLHYRGGEVSPNNTLERVFNNTN